MKIYNKISDIRSELKTLKLNGKSIAFVPTMGFLHSGHLSLVKEAKRLCDIVVVSIFVNQKQFNNEDDFANYPKNLDADIAKLKAQNVDMLFCPNAQEIYPNSNLINFEIDKLASNLCGAYRKGHFQGVALIVSKLFNIINPNIAIFGEKDFQQLQIIRRLVLDLNFDIEILGFPTLREESGLALSSRNARLQGDEILKSANIFYIMNLMKDEILQQKNGDFLDKIIEKYRGELLKFFDKIDYLEICDEENLSIIKQFDANIKARIFVAVYVGKVRLIDNLKIC